MHARKVFMQVAAVEIVLEDYVLIAGMTEIEPSLPGIRKPGSVPGFSMPESKPLNDRYSPKTVVHR